MRNLIVVFSLILGSICFGQVDQARLTVQKLCSPDFHGRGYVNGGDSIAAEYIANQFNSIGCKTFKGGSFQSFNFPVNTFPGVVKMSVNRKDLKPGVDFVVNPDCPNVTSTLLEVKLVDVDLITNPKLLKNLISEYSMERGTHKAGLGLAFQFSIFKGDTLKQAKEMAQIMGDILPVFEIVDTKFTWSVASQQRKFAYVQIQRNAIEFEKNSFLVNLEVQAKLVQHTARNVIAYAPARKKSKKYFVFTAHYDHLGRMGQDTYFPGGNDNASGVAMLLELARYFKANPAEVNVVFIAFAGEEAGLLGSRFYTENPVFDLKKIQFLFNIDIMGSGEDGVTIVNATLFKEQFEALKSINAKQNYVVKVGERGEAANSDHYFFTKKGVPAFFMYTMGPNKNYHDVYDNYEALSFNEFNDIFNLLVEFEKVVAWKR